MQRVHTVPLGWVGWAPRWNLYCYPGSWPVPPPSEEAPDTYSFFLQQFTFLKLLKHVISLLLFIVFCCCWLEFEISVFHTESSWNIDFDQETTPWNPQSRQSANVFLQSSELGPPSLIHRRVCSPPLVPVGGHTRLLERVLDGPNSYEGTDTVVL